MKTQKKVKKGRFGVKFYNGSFLPTDWSTSLNSVGEAVMAADTYCWENELFYVLLQIVDHEGNEMEVVSVEK